MITVVTLGLLAVALVYALIDKDRRMGLEREQWAAERGELLNRVQRPDLLPAVSKPPYDDIDVEPDEIEMVGTINYAETE